MINENRLKIQTEEVREQKKESQIKSHNIKETDFKNITKETISDIAQKFYLNIYETNIWLTLLSRNELTATEISELSTVPRSRTYDILESLEKKGFIIIKPGRPIKYRALEPKKIIDRLKIDSYQELHDKLEFINQIKDTDVLETLNQMYNENQDIVDVSKINESLTDYEIYEKLRNILKLANKSIRMAATPDEIYRIMDNTGGTLYTALKKNLEIKIMLIGEKDGIIERFFGPQNIIYVNNVKLKTIIIDSKETIFFLSKNHAFWTNTNFIGNGFSKLFDYVWNKEKIKINKEIKK